MNTEPLARLDRQDPLAGLRQRFDLPDGIVYLDGHSLGALPRGVADRVGRLVREEWGRDLIASWNSHDWIGLPSRVGDRIGRLLGAAPGQVVCADSISVNLFKLLSAALSLNAGRHVILSQQDNFPTDLYMGQGMSSLLGEAHCTLRAVPEADLLSSLDDQVAVLMLTQVNFRDGRLHDIAAITRRAHQAGALVLWDLAHSAGVVPLELDAWGVDLAVGCGYKYLNGGPGAPAFLYVADRHLQHAAQPLSGWMGHAEPFAFRPGYQPAGGVRRFLAGTPGVLGMAALDAALDVFEGVEIKELRTKSTALTGAFIEAVRGLGLSGLRVITPDEAGSRGSQVSIRHEHGYEIAQALIADGIVVDFRAPDIVRFGFSPLYNRFADVGAAAVALSRIIGEERFRQPQFSERKGVT